MLSGVMTPHIYTAVFYVEHTIQVSLTRPGMEFKISVS